jgi:hypothetical protein
LEKASRERIASRPPKMSASQAAMVAAAPVAVLSGVAPGCQL